jgi:hypothetical protein
MQEVTPHNEAAENSGSPRQPTHGVDRVFISYAREDEAFVLRLASALKGHGIPVWLDQWDIPPGADWDRTIDRALRESGKVIAVLSPEAVASPQVRAEVQLAVNERKAVFPVLYKDCDVPRVLRLYHFSNFREPRSFEPELARLAEALGAKTRPNPAKTPEPPPKPSPPFWRIFVTKFGWLIQQRRFLLAATIGSAVITAMLVVLAIDIPSPSAPTPVVNPEKRKPKMCPLEQTGNLQISVNVDEARISLGGVEVGIARNVMPLILRGVCAGEHRFRVEAPGYVPEERQITIIANRWTLEGVALRQPSPAPVER